MDEFKNDDDEAGKESTNAVFFFGRTKWMSDNARERV